MRQRFIYESLITCETQQRASWRSPEPGIVSRTGRWFEVLHDARARQARWRRIQSLAGSASSPTRRCVPPASPVGCGGRPRHGPGGPHAPMLPVPVPAPVDRRLGVPDGTARRFVRAADRGNGTRLDLSSRQSGWRWPDQAPGPGGCLWRSPRRCWAWWSPPATGSARCCGRTHSWKMPPASPPICRPGCSKSDEVVVAAGVEGLPQVRGGAGPAGASDLQHGGGRVAARRDTSRPPIIRPPIRAA